MLFADVLPTFVAISNATIGTEIPFAGVAFPNHVAVIAGIHFVAPFTRPYIRIVVVVVMIATRSTDTFHSAATALKNSTAVGGTI